MWTKLLSLGWTSWMKFGVIAALVGSGLYLVRDYKNLGVENKSLKVELSTVKNKLDVVEASRSLDRDAIRALDERLKQKSGDLNEFCKIIGDIEKTPGGKEVAGEPIGSALEALKRKAGQK